MGGNLGASRAGAPVQRFCNPNDHQREMLRSSLALWSAGHPWYERLRALALFEIIFYFAYRYGMAFPAAYPSPLWFPDSVLLAALLLTPRKRWWMFIAAQVPIRFFFVVVDGTPTWFLLACFVNDSLKALISATLLMRGSSVHKWFESVRGFMKYLLIAVALSPALSATGGALTRGFLGTPFWPAWRQWFLGDALTALVVTPALYCFLRDFRRIGRTGPARRIEGFLMFFGLVMGAYFAFGLLGHPPAMLLLVYLPVPFLLWAAVRFGPFETSGGLSVMTVLAMSWAAAGRGPFASSSSDAVALSVQLLLVVPAVPFLLLSVLTQQQRLTESALRESEQRFRSLVDTAPMMVRISGQEGACIFFNKRWLDFTGVPFERQVGSGWADCIYPEDRQRCLDVYLPAVLGRAAFNLEYRLRRHDGVYRWIFDGGVPRFDPKGKFLGHLGGCIDVTERKEAEEALRRLPRELINAQEAERQRIGQELHDDVGQQVVALAIGINHLSRQVGENEKLKESFVTLSKQSTDIVRSIASISRQLRPVTLRVLGLAAAFRNLCEESRDPGGVDVVFTQCTELPQISWVCSMAMYRVAQEAVRNALTHSGATRVDLEVTLMNGNLVVSITDKGRGFSPDPNGALLGLGLSGMTERMKDIGGTLNIDSAPGAGTTVTASVPLAEVPQSLPEVRQER